MNPNLLVTKIVVPSRRSDVLRRPRLLDFLHEYIERKLVLISASAGYGKTSLVVDFANDTALPVCWYSLETGDRDPHVFMEYLVAAIQRQFPHFGGHTSALLRSPDESRSVDAIIGALVTELHEQIDTFFVLVLDDYHLVESSQPVNQLLDRLLYFLPENAHVILASRTIPPHLTLTRLTANLQVAGLGAGDLKFTPEEIRALILQNDAMEIAPEMANELAVQSEGWITGIVLTSPALWQGVFREWVKEYTPGSQLFEYLAVEVLAQQPANLQQFLLETSVLAEMDAGMCNELLGIAEASAFFQLAEKRNLFLTRLDREGYRYHHLFREFLQMRLRDTQPARYRHLLRQAAALFERRGKMDQAIEQWLSAGEPAEAARLIEIVAQEQYELGRWATLARWLDALPETVLSQTPILWLWRGMVSVELGASESAANSFDRAIHEFDRRQDALNLARALIESARHELNLDTALERCERALALLPPHEYPIHAFAALTIGALKAQHGDLAGAVIHLERAAALYEIANMRSDQAKAATHLGALYFLTGDRAQAMARFEAARAHWQRVGNSNKLANTLNSIAVARYQQGELAAASDLLMTALEHAQRSGNLRSEAYIHAGLGDIQRDHEKLSDALESFRAASAIAEKIRERFLITYARVAAGEVWRLAGDAGTSEQVLQTALQTASTHRSDYEVALAQIGLGALRLTQNETDAAVRHLDLALKLLEPMELQREIARTRFYLAQAALQRKRDAEALRHLRVVASVGKALEENQFLVSQAARARFVPEFALARRVGVPYFKRLIQKLDLLQRPSVTELAPQDTLPQLELNTLGEARVMMDGELLARSVWQTNTTKELFFFFATNSQGWRKEQIMEALWSNASRGQANDLFHASLYRLRRALFPECIVFRNGLYQLNPEAVRWLDVLEFESEIESAERAGDPLQQIEYLERAVPLYHGDFMEEFYSDWCMHRREQLRLRYLDALAKLARAWTQVGDAHRAIALYQQLLKREPAHEETYRDLIGLHLEMGNRSAALQLYQQCVEYLASEYGVSPAPETSALYQRLV
ncbi:MAG: tetratricopeptide repeat protein [Anaerolineae bacterium]|nr:tetratricopeptide repeat protein [Anaerolineae bacterium]